MNAKARATLLKTLEARFTKHAARHKGIAWDDVLARIDGDGAAIDALHAMEQSGGEPDVIERVKKGGAIVFCDCSAESPAGRRSLCYDQAALDARKEAKPAGSAVQTAADMGVTLLDEAQYRALQELGAFDLKTSSWIATPAPIRKLGGALFCDRRYNHVFTYHNGVQSYYAARGFRARLVV